MPFMSLVTVCMGLGVMDEDYFLTPTTLLAGLSVYSSTALMGASAEFVMPCRPALSIDASIEYMLLCRFATCTFGRVSAWFV